MVGMFYLMLFVVGKYWQLELEITYNQLNEMTNRQGNDVFADVTSKL